MPLYEYRCKKCEQLFELRRSVNDMDKRAKCPKCGSQATARQLSSFAIVQSSGPDLGGGDFGGLGGGDFGGMGDDFGGMGGDDFGGMGGDDYGDMDFDDF